VNLESTLWGIKTCETFQKTKRPYAWAFHLQNVPCWFFPQILKYLIRYLLLKYHENKAFQKLSMVLTLGIFTNPQPWTLPKSIRLALSLLCLAWALILAKPMPKARLYPTCNLFCLFLSSPLTRRHNEQDGQVSWCLTDITTVQNPHAHIANHETH